MDTDVWILGGYQSDFARNLTKEGSDFAALTGEVVDATLTAAKVDAADIGVVHVANAFGEMFARQGHLGAMPATVCDGLWDTPASRHEAACASGSVAALSAIADLRSGAYDAALVIGIELEKTVPGDTAARHLGAAAWTGHEGADATLPLAIHVRPSRRRVRPPLRPGRRAPAGHRTAELRQRRRNPTPRPGIGPSPTRSSTTTRANPITEGRLRRFDCSQMTDGGAGIGTGQRHVSARSSRRAARSPASMAGATAPSGWVCDRNSIAPRRPVRHAACAGRGTRRDAPRTAQPRRRRRIRGA